MFAISEVSKGAGCVADMLLAFCCTSCCTRLLHEYLQLCEGVAESFEEQSQLKTSSWLGARTVATKGN